MAPLRRAAQLLLPLLILSAAARLTTAQPPLASMPASMAMSTAVGRKSAPPLTSAAAATDLQDVSPWDEEDAIAELGDEVENDDEDDEGRLRRRAAPSASAKRGDSGGGGGSGGGCQLLMSSRSVRRRLSQPELRRLLHRLVKEHHVFHLPGKRVGSGVSRQLCRYGKRGQWRPCSLHYKRLQGRRPYAYHWPIMNILGGALG